MCPVTSRRQYSHASAELAVVKAVAPKAVITAVNLQVHLTTLVSVICLCFPYRLSKPQIAVRRALERTDFSWLERAMASLTLSAVRDYPSGAGSQRSMVVPMSI